MKLLSELEASIKSKIGALDAAAQREQFVNVYAATGNAAGDRTLG